MKKNKTNFATTNSSYSRLDVETWTKELVNDLIRHGKNIIKSEIVKSTCPFAVQGRIEFN